MPYHYQIENKEGQIMVEYEFISEEKVAVFLSGGWGKGKAKKSRVGSIVKLGEKQWQYVTTDGTRGEVFASVGLVKKSLEGDE